MPSDLNNYVQVDITKLNPTQKKVLDELVAAANKKPLTHTEVLENRINNLENTINQLLNRVSLLEFGNSYKTAKDPWVFPGRATLEAPPPLPSISTTGGVLVGGGDPIPHPTWSGGIGAAQGSINALDTPPYYDDPNPAVIQTRQLPRRDPTDPNSRPINPNDDR